MPNNNEVIYACSLCKTYDRVHPNAKSHLAVCEANEIFDDESYFSKATVNGKTKCFYIQFA